MDLFLAVMRRELAGSQRRRNLYLSRVAFVFLGAGILLFGLVIGRLNTWATGGAGGLSGTGLVLFQILAYLTIPGACLAAPCAAATVFAGEKESGTLGLLLVSDASPTALVLGRFLALATMAVANVLSLVPLVMLCVSFGGVSTSQLLKALGLLLATIVFGIALGLAISALARTARYAYFGVLLLSLAFYGLLPIGLYAGVEAGYLSSWWQTRGLLLVSPVVTLYTVINGTPGTATLACIGTLLAAAVLLLGLAILLLPRLAVPVPVLPRAAADHRGFQPQRGHPLVWRARPRRLLPLAVLLSVLAAAFGAALWRLDVGGSSWRAIPISLGLGCTFLYWLCVYLECAQVFARERQERTLDLLVNTPLSDAELLLATLWGVARGYLPFLAGTLLAAVVLMATGDFARPLLFLRLVVAATFAGGAVCLTWSLTEKRTGATIGAVLLFMLAAAALPFAALHLVAATIVEFVLLIVGYAALESLLPRVRLLALAEPKGGVS